jgi:hypothetical protein
MGYYYVIIVGPRGGKQVREFETLSSATRFATSVRLRKEYRALVVFGLPS